ncbi:MAG: hypothetical protein A2452_00275 [Candidatus Firestonebacteria bacterium RIFOXYC2_FULL_39_67]|nr:MAG: hypothetical protein A2536_05980 [Candidatus Firestonebacteria bacterium RIFOXYD2_FULL_39_29]OGF54239.1 MAG: hypothetical protein A2452_00275 [Candidatus Firestonebacteria bacterium RIFOXYC2_FULL_39_67]
MKKVILVTGLFLVFLSGSPVFAKSGIPVPTTIDMVPVKAGPKIDGVLDDVCWKTAVRTTPFVNIFGDSAPRESIALFCQDADNFYIGLKFSAPEGVFASKVTGRDEGTIWQEEDAEIFLDVSNSHKSYYQILLSSAGGLADSYHREQDCGDITWNGNIESKVVVGEKEWTAELKIPFASFTRSSKITSTIGVNISRGDMNGPGGKGRADYFWAPSYSGTPHRPDLFAHIKGLKGKKITQEDLPHVVKESQVTFEKVTGNNPKVIKPAKEVAPEFTKGPEVVMDKGKVKISFTANTFTDVTVEIKDSTGKTVRNLVSGVLGDNPPEPLQKKSLAQVIYWDGKDNFGKKVISLDGCSVKISLGMEAKLDKLMGYTPFGNDRITGATIDKKGNVYLMHSNSNVRDVAPRIESFDRNGEYARTVLPFPADIPEEKLGAIDFAHLANGESIPVQYHRNGSFLPYGDEALIQEMAVMGEDQVIFISRNFRWDTWRLVSVNGDGSTPKDCFGPRLWTNLWSGAYLAADSDSGYVYMTSVSLTYTYDARSNEVTRKPAAVFRTKMKPDAEVEEFIGGIGFKGSKEAHVNSPDSVAVGKDGKVFVGDSGNGEVAVFSKDGKFLKAYPVPGAEYMAVDKNTDDCYVLSTSYDKKVPSKLVYISGSGSVKDAISYPEGGGGHVLVDSAVKPAIIWVIKNGVKSYVNKGGTLEERKLSDKAAIKQKGRHTMYHFVIVDKETEKIYSTIRGGSVKCFDGKTGDEIPGKFPGGADIAIGPDGSYYALSVFPYQIIKYDPKKDFAVVKKIVLKDSYLGERGGMSIASNGEIYVFEFAGPTGGYRNIGSTMYGQVNVYSPDGTLKKREVARATGGSSNGVKSDLQGNVYIGDNIRYLGRFYPKAVTGADGIQGVDNLTKYDPAFLNISDGKFKPVGGGSMNRNRFMKIYGSVIKFSPGAGIGGSGIYWPTLEGKIEYPEIASKEKPNFWGYTEGGIVPLWLTGYQWVYDGVAPSPAASGGGDFSCSCDASRFDVDDYGRVYVPDAIRFAVQVLDTNGNPLLRFGSYGNSDSGPGRRLGSKPEIPFLFPKSVAVSKDAIYVTDKHSYQIVKAKIGYKKEKTVKISR